VHGDAFRRDITAYLCSFQEGVEETDALPLILLISRLHGQAFRIVSGQKERWKESQTGKLPLLQELEACEL